RAGGEQTRETPRQAPRCGSEAPDGDTQRDQPGARAGVAQRPEERRRHHVDDEKAAAEEAELKVGETQLGAPQGLPGHANGGAVQVVEQVDHREDCEPRSSPADDIARSGGGHDPAGGYDSATMRWKRGSGRSASNPANRNQNHSTAPRGPARSSTSSAWSRSLIASRARARSVATKGLGWLVSNVASSRATRCRAAVISPPRASSSTSKVSSDR